jgi:ATP-binding cassette, subfamily B, bacterial PglK
MFKKLLSLLTLNERKNAVILVFLMLIGVILEALGVGLVIPALALMLHGDIGSRYPIIQPLLRALGNPTQPQLLLGAMIGLVAIYFVKNFYAVLLTWRQTRFAVDMQTNLAQRLFTIYLRQNYAFHLTRNSAQLINNITSEVSVCALVMSNTLGLTTELMVLLGIGALLVAVEPMGALIVVTVLGVAACGFHYALRARVIRWGEARQHHGALGVQHLQQGLGGAKEVKLMGRERDFVAQYAFHNLIAARAGGLQTVVQQLPRLWLELLAVVGMAILVETMLLQGRELTSIVSTVGLFAAAAFRLMPSINRVLSATQSLRYSLPAVDRVCRELKLATPEIGSQENGGDCPFERAIDLINITYRYPGASAAALQNLSLTVKKGESVGLIGSSGSGKSTTVDLVLGLLTPSCGQISVDRRDIQTCLRSWQDKIGYVPQSIYLTDDTLRRNIAFGLPSANIDDAAVQRAIKAAQLADFVDSLPMKLETVVGERGVRLSGGQRQRIGVARALYHDPPVLVLDEATSALDFETERGVMEAVSALKGTKTILIIAHRLSTVERCDRLYKIEKGTVVLHGAPTEILANKRAEQVTF